MNRLTILIDGQYKENHDNDTRQWKNGDRECMAKLGKYEDTGLEPQEIKEVLLEKGALEMKINQKALNYIYDDEPLCPFCGELVEDGRTQCECGQVLYWE